jgi:hypothetical protein
MRDLLAKNRRHGQRLRREEATTQNAAAYIEKRHFRVGERMLYT